MFLAWALISHAAEAACTEPQAGSDRAPALSPPLSPIVIGSGRLQFHSAPDSACPMKGVFIIPKEEVIAYVQMRDGWSSIMYLNPRTSNDISGWVRSARLRTVGTMGPKR
ncbi:hypothetical protein [Bosea beijingensis]|jgi:hypothetical protein